MVAVLAQYRRLHSVSIHLMCLVLQGSVGLDTASVLLTLVEEGGTQSYQNCMSI